MNSRMMITAAMRAVMTVGAIGLVSAGPPAVAQTQDSVTALAADIQAEVVAAQQQATALGLSGAAAAALVQQAVQRVIAASGQPQSVVFAALNQAQTNLERAGVLSAAGNSALAGVRSSVTASLGTGAGNGSGGSSAIGGTSGGSGGGGGSDYRVGGG